MKVTVTGNFLNVRVGSPSLNAPANVYLSPGDVIEVHDKVYKGDNYNGIDDWHGDDANNFYWKGNLTAGTGGTVYYNSFLKAFDQKTLSTQGADTTVTVIDEGMLPNPTYFDTAQTQIVSTDPGTIVNKHGNFIGGILAGKFDVIGLVPKAKLVAVTFKTNNTPAPQYLQNMVAALQQVLAQPGPSVVNISQVISKYALAGCDTQKAAITTLMQQIAAKPNKFLICSAGDNVEMTLDLFPAAAGNCITVGAIDVGYKKPVPSSINILAPRVTFTSLGLDFKQTTDLGCSFTTAVITALVSAIISSRLPSVTSKTDLIADLKKYGTDRNSFQYGALANFQYQIN